MVFTTESYPRLAAHLFEATGDDHYMDAAISAAEFIQAHMVHSPVIMDTFNISGCVEVTTRPAWTYTTGFTIWGVSVIASHNETWTSL